VAAPPAVDPAADADWLDAADPPDVVVVGGGTAGPVVAQHLSRTGRRVLLLEAGPDPGPVRGGRWPRDLLDPARVAVSHDWGYHGPAADGRVLAFPRARVLGGCSAHNGCTQSVGWGPDYDALDVASLRAERVGVLLPELLTRLGVRIPAHESLSPLQYQFLAAAVTAGHRQTDDLLDPAGGAGACVSPVNLVDGLRWNNALAFLDRERVDDRLGVLGDAQVDRVELRVATATAVHATICGVRRRIVCGSVVLCAGAFGTPEILLRSGIGPHGHLAALGIEPRLDLPGVGQGIADHPVLALTTPAGRRLAAELTAMQDMQGAVPDEGVVIKADSGLDPDGAPYDLHLLAWTEKDPTTPHGWSVTVAAALLRPRSRGDLLLRSADPAVRAAVRPGYLAERDDVDRLIVGWRQVRDLLPGLDVLPVTDQPGIPSPATSMAVSRSWARGHHTHYWHPVGGAGIGDPDQNGVLHPSFGVHGTDNLYVADASAFTAIPRATTALPVTLLAKAAADVIGRR
jgi:choline dehydrogenase